MISLRTHAAKSILLLLALNTKLKAEDQPKTATTISLESILQGFRKNNDGRQKINESMSALAASLKDNDSRRFVGPYNLETKGEMDPKEPADSAKIEAVLKKKMVFGLDSDAIARRHDSETEAERLTKTVEAGESELEVAKLFVGLRQKQAVVLETKIFLETLSSLLKKTKAAARMGNLGGLLVTKWELYFDSLTAELEQVSGSYSGIASTLSSQTGFVISKGPEESRLDPINISVDSLSVAQSPQVKAGVLKEQALNAKITQTRSVWDLDVGVGVSREIGKQTNAVILEVGIPLGTGAAAQSEISSIEAEKQIIKVETNLKEKQLKQKHQIALMNIEDGRKNLAITLKRVAGLEELLSKADRAFLSGQGDVGDVLEISKELYETKMKAKEVLAGLEERYLDLKYLMTGELL